MSVPSSPVWRRADSGGDATQSRANARAQADAMDVQRADEGDCETELAARLQRVAHDAHAEDSDEFSELSAWLVMQMRATPARALALVKQVCAALAPLPGGAAGAERTPLQLNTVAVDALCAASECAPSALRSLIDLVVMGAHLAARFAAHKQHAPHLSEQACRALCLRAARVGADAFVRAGPAARRDAAAVREGTSALAIACEELARCGDEDDARVYADQLVSLHAAVRRNGTFIAYTLGNVGVRALREGRHASAVHWLALSDGVLASVPSEKADRVAKRARTLRVLAVALGEVERATDALAALQHADALPNAPAPDFATRLLRCRLQFRCGLMRDADAALGELLSAPLTDAERSACINLAVEFGRASALRTLSASDADSGVSGDGGSLAVQLGLAQVLLGELDNNDDGRRDKQRKAKDILLRICNRVAASVDARSLLSDASVAPVVSLLWNEVGSWRGAASETASADQRDWLRIIACLSSDTQRAVAQLTLAFASVTEDAGDSGAEGVGVPAPDAALDAAVAEANARPPLDPVRALAVCVSVAKHLAAGRTENALACAREWTESRERAASSAADSSAGDATAAGMVVALLARVALRAGPDDAARALPAPAAYVAMARHLVKRAGTAPLPWALCTTLCALYCNTAIGQSASAADAESALLLSAAALDAAIQLPDEGDAGPPGLVVQDLAYIAHAAWHTEDKVERAALAAATLVRLCAAAKRHDVVVLRDPDNVSVCMLGAAAAVSAAVSSADDSQHRGVAIECLRLTLSIETEANSQASRTQALAHVCLAALTSADPVATVQAAARELVGECGAPLRVIRDAAAWLQHCDVLVQMAANGKSVAAAFLWSAFEASSAAKDGGTPRERLALHDAAQLGIAAIVAQTASVGRNSTFVLFEKVRAALSTERVDPGNDGARSGWTSDEAHWLAGTAWNTCVHWASMGRFENAERWGALAVEVAGEHAPDATARQMREQYASVLQCVPR